MKRLNPLAHIGGTLAGVYAVALIVTELTNHPVVSTRVNSLILAVCGISAMLYLAAYLRATILEDT